MVLTCSPSPIRSSMVHCHQLIGVPLTGVPGQ